jgi:hypothetical protein
MTAQLDEGTKVYTQLFTNVPGSREDWYLDGKRIFAYGFSVTGGLIPLSWAAISHKDNIKVSMCADKAAI